MPSLLGRFNECPRIREQSMSYGTTGTTPRLHLEDHADVLYQPVKEDDPQLTSKVAQEGVRLAEATTNAWTKTSLRSAYVFMWLLYFVNAWRLSLTSNLLPFITSGFESHSLIPVIVIVSSIMGAVTYMPLAKVLNVWDRSTGFAIMVLFAMVGLILSATCNGIGVFCASQVFYSIGFTGIIFAVDVVTADTSTLRDRGLAYAFTASPYIITAFAGPKAAMSFNDNNWRWAFGTFAIILPFVALPFFVLLRYNRNVAMKKGLIPSKAKSNRTIVQSIWYYAVQFDLIGTFLLGAALILILLPFTIAQAAANGWREYYIIFMLVVGIACLLAFGFVERFVAPVPFLPWEMLSSRTVIGTCLLDATYLISYYCWNDYFSSYLQVVYGVDLATGGYISNVFDVVSGIWLLAVGLLIKKSGRFRWLLIIAVPLYILGIGLMIYFRRPSFSVGYTVMCQIFLAFAGGTMIICQQVAILAVSDHKNVASSLAFLGVFGNIGGGIGSSVSGAIWTQSLPDALQRLLPQSAVNDWEKIYDDINVQLSYPLGSPERTAIIAAYAQSQSRMLIAGTAIMALSLIWIFVIQDIKVTKTQTKGVLF
ncbi:major facilitator superfamily domain-containing protein [Acrodontium crateriforme]|uniref:Major facilitator superfamily domain-containing protein n=1 Tax=Acrodontium crateriforme TaxID=150365 RepID=A0AAQ3MA11_9PEZI|nr:major facilitator superfamily domain-containing protein [Acrodontium crateriforme]